MEPLEGWEPGRQLDADIASWAYFLFVLHPHFWIAHIYLRQKYYRREGFRFLRLLTFCFCDIVILVLFTASLIRNSRPKDTPEEVMVVMSSQSGKARTGAMSYCVSCTDKLKQKKMENEGLSPAPQHD